MSFKEGQKCVVTCVSGRSEACLSFGDIITCEALSYEWRAGELSPRGLFMRPCYKNGMIVQVTDKISPRWGVCVAHPVDWMKPLSDPDEVSLYTEEEETA